MNWLRRHLLTLIAASLLIGLGVSLWLSGPELGRTLLSLPVWVLPLGFAMIVLGWNVNALRVRLLLAGQGVRTRHAKNLGVVMSTEFAHVATPFGSGAPLTFVYLNQRRGVAPTTSSAVFAVDQLFDMVFFLTTLPLLFVALAGLPERLHVGAQIMVMAVLLVTTLVLVLVAIRHYRWLILATAKPLHLLRLQPSTRRRLARALMRFRLAVVTGLRMPARVLISIYLLCALHWMLRYGVLFVLITALSLTPSFAYVFFVQLVTMGLGQLSFLPGGTGTVEVGFSLLLGPLVPTLYLGAVLFSWRLVTFYWYLLAGGVVFAMMAGYPLWKQFAARPDDVSSSDPPEHQRGDDA
jgi:glycosyltransferase 2 family protein